jgi:COP9 signalosome complex subunit 5
MDAGPARQRWELENSVLQVPTEDVDVLYRYDAAEQSAIQHQKPWARDPHFFKQ